MNRRKLIKLTSLLGLSPLVSFKGVANTCDITTSDIQGPFYTPNAPVKQKLSPIGAAGTPLFIKGTVFAKDCETPLPSSKLDVWHADDSGEYDNVGYNYRGVFNADTMGNYAMETILPGKYLNGSSYRPRHIHFKIQGGGSNELTTQLYFEGDTSIPDALWASYPSAEHCIIPLSEDDKGNLQGVFDITLDIGPADMPTDLQHIQTGHGGNHIASISTTSSRTAEVRFLLAQPLKDVQLLVYNLYGQRLWHESLKLVNVGENRVKVNMRTKYGLRRPQGIYIMQLLVNNQLADAKRFYAK